MHTHLSALGMAIFEAAPDAILVSDAQGIIVLANQRTEAMFGYSREELVGQSIELLVASGKRDMHAGFRRRYAQDPQVRPMGEARRLEAIHKLGQAVPVEISLSPIEIEGQPHVIAIARDVTHLREYQHFLEYASTHDEPTALCNRAYFDADKKRIEKGRRFPVTALVFDVNDLKQANDTFGHEVGDALIVAAAKVLKAAFRQGDLLARIGGDEFAVLLPGIDQAQAQLAISRVRLEVQKYNDQSPKVPLSLAIGVATGGKGASMDGLLRQADEVMYRDKQRFKDLRAKSLARISA